MKLMICGKTGFQERMKASGQGLMAGPPLFAPGMDLDSLPQDCVARIAREADLPFSIILNNIPSAVLSSVEAKFTGLDILGTLPHTPELFTATLEGAPLDMVLPEMADLGKAVAVLSCRK